MKRLILSAVALLSFATSDADAQYYRQRFRQRAVIRERVYAPLSLRAPLTFRQRVYAPLSFSQSIYEPEAVIFEERIIGGGGLLNLNIGRPRSRLFLGERRGLLNIQIGD